MLTGASSNCLLQMVSTSWHEHYCMYSGKTVNTTE